MKRAAFRKLVPKVWGTFGVTGRRSRGTSGVKVAWRSSSEKDMPPAVSPVVTTSRSVGGYVVEAAGVVDDVVVVAGEGVSEDV